MPRTPLTLSATLKPRVGDCLNFLLTSLATTSRRELMAALIATDPGFSSTST